MSAESDKLQNALNFKYGAATPTEIQTALDSKLFPPQTVNFSGDGESPELTIASHANKIITNEGSTGGLWFGLPPLVDCIAAKCTFRFLATRHNDTNQLAIYSCWFGADPEHDDNSHYRNFRNGQNANEYSLYASDVGDYIELIPMAVNEILISTSNHSGSLALGLSVTGGTSGATGRIIKNTGSFLINVLTGTFVNGEDCAVNGGGSFTISSAPQIITSRWVVGESRGWWEDRD